MSGQAGIETGSLKLIDKYMKGKVKPFKSEQWPEIVRESHKLQVENNWVPCNTLIMGLPGEKPDDIRKTIELVEDIKRYKSIIVPLFFVPIGTLKNKKFFQTKDMISEHWQLLACCINHNFTWLYELADISLRAAGLSRIKRFAVKRIIGYSERKIEPYKKLMEDGLNPITYKN
jgi:radical SAM superfamily enzyme YgiQ (UPF0313 family)